MEISDVFEEGSVKMVKLREDSSVLICSFIHCDGSSIGISSTSDSLLGCVLLTEGGEGERDWQTEVMMSGDSDDMEVRVSSKSSSDSSSESKSHVAFISNVESLITI
jgi:hypothetical protein